MFLFLFMYVVPHGFSVDCRPKLSPTWSNRLSCTPCAVTPLAEAAHSSSLSSSLKPDRASLLLGRGGVSRPVSPRAVGYHVKHIQYFPFSIVIHPESGRHAQAVPSKSSSLCHLTEVELGVKSI